MQLIAVFRCPAQGGIDGGEGFIQISRDVAVKIGIVDRTHRFNVGIMSTGSRWGEREDAREDHPAAQERRKPSIPTASGRS